MITPDSLGLHNQVAVTTRIGTKGVRIEGDRIVGLWANATEFVGPKRRLLIEDFLNWDKDPRSIARFTTTYAPLLWSTPEVGLPCEEKEFSFYIEDWLRIQEHLQDVWRTICGSENKSTAFGGYFSETDGIEVQSGKLVLRASNLRLFMVMEIMAGPLERLRICKKPGCITPYFLAHHLKQTYCSPSCAEWAQREVKKKWWAESGESWLASRARQKRIRTKQTSRKARHPGA